MIVYQLSMNHERWFICPHCGEEYDLRASRYCDTCNKHYEAPVLPQIKNT